MMKSRRMRWSGHSELKAEMRNALEFLVGKPEGKTTR
jgi:hypothetical protein